MGSSNSTSHSETTEEGTSTEKLTLGNVEKGAEDFKTCLKKHLLILKDNEQNGQDTQSNAGQDWANRVASEPTYSNFPQELTRYYKNYNPDQPHWRSEMGDKLAEVDGFAHTLVEYVTYLTSNMYIYPYQIDKKKHSFLERILKAVLKYSDASKRFAVKLGENNIVEVLVNLLKEYKQQSRNYQTEHEYALFYPTIGSVFNLSLQSENLEYFKECNAIETMMHFVTSKEVDHQEWTHACAVFTLANIVDEDNSDQFLAHDKGLKWIINGVKRAANARNGRYQGYAVNSFLMGLKKLAVNNRNSLYIVKYGVLDKLLLVMRKGDDEDRNLATETLWALSFVEKNKNKFRKSNELQQHLQKFAKICTCNDQASEDASNLKKTAEKVLWILKPDTMPGAGDIPSQLKHSKGKERHIMFSYPWIHQDTVKRIKNKLVQHGYKVWIDFERMSGSILQAMARAVEEASIVLVCFAQRYKESPNCRTEGEYAHYLEKEIIPLKMEQKYKPDGWLGALLGQRLYYDFSNQNTFDKSLEQLLQQLQKSKKALQDTKTAIEDTEADEESTKKLTITPESGCQQVADWANQENVSRVIPKNMDGETLLFLKKMKEHSLEYFCKYIKEHWGINKLCDIVDFDEALDKI